MLVARPAHPPAQQKTFLLRARKRMEKRVVLFTVFSAVLTFPALAQMRTAFGLSRYTSVGTLNFVGECTSNNFCPVAAVPDPHSDLAEYSVQASRDVGICAVVGTMRIGRSPDEQNAGLALADLLARQLAQAIGVPGLSIGDRQVWYDVGAFEKVELTYSFDVNYRSTPTNPYARAVDELQFTGAFHAVFVFSSDSRCRVLAPQANDPPNPFLR